MRLVLALCGIASAASAAVMCGDGKCDRFYEDMALCQVDCWCGDGLCDASEAAETCPQDCVSGCGDGICAPGESAVTCVADCGCGDGVCSPHEDARSCASDCFCGDGVCDATEDSDGCATDCGLRMLRDESVVPLLLDDCADGVLGGNETDVDCGGPNCEPCDDGLQCLLDADCDSNDCSAHTGVCVATTCSDGWTSGNETDIDCGGPDCAPCGVGMYCTIDADCDSNVCSAHTGMCELSSSSSSSSYGGSFSSSWSSLSSFADSSYIDASCTDGVLGGNETDVDCGGPDCEPCGGGGKCYMDADCESNFCSAHTGLCVSAESSFGGSFSSLSGSFSAFSDSSMSGFSSYGLSDDSYVESATCADGMLSGNETDVDCGGPDCEPCGGGGKCHMDADCESNFCSAHTGLCVSAESSFGGSFSSFSGSFSAFSGSSMSGFSSYGLSELSSFSASSSLSLSSFDDSYVVSATCADGMLSGNETDVDCGGPDCEPCGGGGKCHMDADCESNFCSAHTGLCVSTESSFGGSFSSFSGSFSAFSGSSMSGFSSYSLSELSSFSESSSLSLSSFDYSYVVSATCADGMLGGNETDVDCGGPDCEPCGGGGKCHMDADCESNFCSAHTGLCVSTESSFGGSFSSFSGSFSAFSGSSMSGFSSYSLSELSSFSGASSGSADCYSVSDASDLSFSAKSEFSSSAFSSLSSLEGSYVLDAACADGVLSGNETDVDCGGPDCEPCGGGGKCHMDADCESNFCSAHTGLCVSTESSFGGSFSSFSGSFSAFSGSSMSGFSSYSLSDLSSFSASSSLSSLSLSSFDDSYVVSTTCADGTLGGNETDVDCGGPECEPCGGGGKCHMDADCESNFCSAHTGLCVSTESSFGGSFSSFSGSFSSFSDSSMSGFSSYSLSDLSGVSDASSGSADCYSVSDASDLSFSAKSEFSSSALSSLSSLDGSYVLDAACADGMLSGNETDLDCGGPDCEPCGGGGKCHMDADCESNFCSAHTGLCVSTESSFGGSFLSFSGSFSSFSGSSMSGFSSYGLSELSSFSESLRLSLSSFDDSYVVSATCADGMLSGNETDVDCGGPDCEPCGGGGKCHMDADCESNFCSAHTGLCVSTESSFGGSFSSFSGSFSAFSGSSMSGFSSYSLSDLSGVSDASSGSADCYSVSDASDLSFSAKSEFSSSALSSLSSLDGSYVLDAACADGMLSGNETDVDCGGPDCEPCSGGLGCHMDADCESNFCSAHTGLCTSAESSYSSFGGSLSSFSASFSTFSDSLSSSFSDSMSSYSFSDLSSFSDASALSSSLSDSMASYSFSDASSLSSFSAKSEFSSHSFSSLSSFDDSYVLDAACADGVLGGNETDVDCGGPDCEPCGGGLKCHVDADCESNFCSAHTGLCVSAESSFGGSLSSFSASFSTFSDSLSSTLSGSMASYSFSDLSSFSDASSFSANSEFSSHSFSSLSSFDDSYVLDAACADGVLGGNETDVDCGGPDCEPCSGGLKCHMDADCESNFCSAHTGLCVSAESSFGGSLSSFSASFSTFSDSLSSSFSDSMSSYSFSDVSSFSATFSGSIASYSFSDESSFSDASSLSAKSEFSSHSFSSLSSFDDNYVLDSACADGVLGGNETDVDCGGPDCEPCSGGLKCHLDADCESNFCSAHTGLCISAESSYSSFGGSLSSFSASFSTFSDSLSSSFSGSMSSYGVSDLSSFSDASSLSANSEVSSHSFSSLSSFDDSYVLDSACADGVLGGNETDVDCGGPDCEPCSGGLKCHVDADCESNFCSAHTGLCTSAESSYSSFGGSLSSFSASFSTFSDSLSSSFSGSMSSYGFSDLSSFSDTSALSSSLSDSMASYSFSDLSSFSSFSAKSEFSSHSFSSFSSFDDSYVLDSACADGVLGGNETDVDCGGPDCEPCGGGLKCHMDADCESNFCSAHTGLCTSAESSYSSFGGSLSSFSASFSTFGDSLSSSFSGSMSSYGVSDLSSFSDASALSSSLSGSMASYSFSDASSFRDASSFSANSEFSSHTFSSFSSFDDSYVLDSACADGVLGGNETDVDCGGPDCEPCSGGLKCHMDADCESNFCSAHTGLCTSAESSYSSFGGSLSSFSASFSTFGDSLSSSFSGSMSSYGVSDLSSFSDASALSSSLSDSMASYSFSDLSSFSSFSAKSEFSSHTFSSLSSFDDSYVLDSACADGVLGGNETDVDCGGPDCEPCSGGLKCHMDADCESNFCSAHTGLCTSAESSYSSFGGSLSSFSASFSTFSDSLSSSFSDSMSSYGVSDLSSFSDASALSSSLSGSMASYSFSDASSFRDASSFSAKSEFSSHSFSSLSSFDDSYVLDSACADGVLGGNETDVDCGGPDCEPCSGGLKCHMDADCESNFCSAHTGLCTSAESSYSSFGGSLSSFSASFSTFGDSLSSSFSDSMSSVSFSSYSDSMSSYADSMSSYSDAMSDSMSSYSDSMSSYSDSMSSYSDSMSSYSHGMSSFIDGMSSYSDDTSSYSHGMSSYGDGLSSFSDGVSSYSDGMSSYSHGSDGLSSYSASVSSYSDADSTSEVESHDMSTYDSNDMSEYAGESVSSLDGESGESGDFSHGGSSAEFSTFASMSVFESAVVGDDDDYVEPTVPLFAASAFSFADEDLQPDSILGTVTIEPALDESDITYYAVYWSAGSGTLSDEPIAVLAPTGQTLELTITSLEADYLLVRTGNDVGEMAGGLLAAVYDAAAIIVDDFAAAGFAVAEGTGQASLEYSIVLGMEPSVDVAVSVTSSTGDVEGTSITFSPDNWASAQTIEVSAIDDGTVEDELHWDAITFVAAAADGSSSITFGSLDAVDSAATLSYDVGVVDKTGGITVDASSLSLTEGDSGLVGVSLTSNPVDDVTVATTSGDDTLVTATQLTFTADNWASAQYVEIAAVDDDAARSSYSVDVTLESSSADSLFALPACADVSATSTDDGGQETSRLYVSSGDSCVFLVQNTAVTSPCDADPCNSLSGSWFDDSEVEHVVVHSLETGELTIDGEVTSATFDDSTGAWTIDAGATAEIDTMTWPQESWTRSGTDSCYWSVFEYCYVLLDVGCFDTDVLAWQEGESSTAACLDAVAVDVTDNDAAGVSLSVTDLVVSTGAEPSIVDYTVSVESEPLEDVVITVSLTGNDGNLVTVSPESQTVAAGSAPGSSVTFNIVGTSEVVDTASFVYVSHTVSSDDALYSRLADVTVNVFVSASDIVIDETPPPTLMAAALSDTAYEVLLTFTADDASGELWCLNSDDTRELCGSSTACDVASLLSADTIAALGTDNVECSWTSNAEVTVAYSDTALAAGEQIILAGSYAASTEEAIFFASGSVTLSDRLPAPVLQSVKFLDSGAALLATFDSDSSRLIAGLSGKQACTLVFEDADALLGLGAQCSWSSSTELRMDLGSGATVEPYLAGLLDCVSGKSVQIIEGTITAVADGLLSSSGCVNVDAADSPPTPTPVLIAPLTVGQCDDLVLDGSTSTGGGGREMTFEWSVALADNTGAGTGVLLGDLIAVLDEATTANENYITISRDVLEAGAIYDFTLGVSNFLTAGSNTMTQTVTKSSFAIPSLSIVGATSRSVRRYDSIKIRADGASPTCDSNETLPLTYTWAALEGDVAFQASNDPRSLNVAPYSLDFGTTYRFEVTASVDLELYPDVYNTAEVEVELYSTYVVANIRGGNRVVGVDSVLTLDASETTTDNPSGSEDLDQMDSVDWAFEWSCTSLETGEACVDVNSGETFNMADYHDGTGVVTVDSPLPLNDGASYVFTVVASKGTDGADEPYHLRSDSASVTVEVQQGDPPAVAVAMVDPVRKVNPSEKLILEGEAVGVVDIASVQWTQESGDLTMDDSDIPDSSYLSTPADRTVIVFAADALTPAGSYTFRMSATDVQGNTGYAELELTINAPPSSGYVEVSPRVGFVLTTTFEFVASLWTDDVDDLPLSYAFRYIEGPDDDDVSEVAISSSFSDSSRASALLPAGPKSNDYNLTVVVYVKDSLGAQARSSSLATLESCSVQVTEQEIDLDSTSDLLDSFVTGGDNSAVFQVLNALGGVLSDPCDDVDCGVYGTCDEGICLCDSPFYGDTCEDRDGNVTEWSSWSECSVTCGGGTQTRSRTCTNPAPAGDGLDCTDTLEEEAVCNEEVCVVVIDGGYGEWGEWGECSNSCPGSAGGYFVGTRTRVRQCDSPRPTATGQSCSVLGDSSETEDCNTDRCEAPIAACPGATRDTSYNIVEECSGNGYCVREPSTCTEEFRSDCTIECVCDDGWNGNDCSMDDETLAARQAMRSNMLSAMSTSSGSVDVSDEALKQQADTFGVVMGSPDEVNADTIVAANDFVGSMLGNSASNGGLGRNTGATMGAAMANMVSAARSNNRQRRVRRLLSVDDLNVIEDVNSLAGLMIQDSVAGEDAATVSTGEFGFSAAVESVDNLDNFDVSGSTSRSSDNTQFSFPSSVTDGIATTSRRRMGEIGGVARAKERRLAGIERRLAGIDVDEHGRKLEARRLSDVSEVSLQAVSWEIDTSSANIERVATTTSMSLFDDSSQELDVSGLAEPIQFRVALASTADPNDATCSYYDEASDSWNTMGMTMVGFEVSDGTTYLVCETVHLTDFTVAAAAAAPGVNSVDPVADAGLLAAYGSGDRMFVLIVLCGVWFYFAVSTFHLHQQDKKRKARLQEACETMFLVTGAYEPLDKPESLWGQYKDRVRAKHDWVSVWAPPLSDAAILARHRRNLILLCNIMCAFAVNALFFGKGQAGIAGKIMGTLVSAIVMLPPSSLLPQLFERINSPPALKHHAAEKPQNIYLACLKRVLCFGWGTPPPKTQAKVAIEGTTTTTTPVEPLPPAERPPPLEIAAMSSEDDEPLPEHLLKSMTGPPMDMLKKMQDEGRASPVMRGPPVSVLGGDSPQLASPQQRRQPPAKPRTPLEGPRPAKRAWQSKSESKTQVQVQVPLDAPTKTEDLTGLASPADTAPKTTEVQQPYRLRRPSLDDWRARKAPPDRLVGVQMLLNIGLLLSGMIALVGGMYLMSALPVATSIALAGMITGLALLGLGFAGAFSGIYYRTVGQRLGVRMYAWVNLTCLAGLIVLIALFAFPTSISEEVMGKEWGNTYESSEGRDELQTIQDEHACCGYTGPDDMPVGDCHVLQDGEVALPGCRDDVSDMLQTNLAPLVVAAFLGTIFGFLALLATVAVLRRRSLATVYLSSAYAHADEEVAGDLNVTPHELRLILRVQRVFRGHQGRIRAERKLRLTLFQRHKLDILNYAAYSVLVLLTLFSTYLNLIFGVKFSESESREWLISSIIAFTIDVAMTQPIKVFVYLIKAHLGQATRDAALYLSA